MRFVRWLLCFLGLAAGALAATAPTASPQKTPNIILITLDTVRADRMGFLGSKRGLTPNLDALARQSVVFTRAYSQVPLTTASHATILTGTYPQYHQVNDFGVPLAADLPYAPDILKARGYHTGAFIGSLILDPEARSAPGFERGFEIYDAGFHRRRPGEDRYSAIERRGGEVVGRALTWLSRQPPGPFFLWVHLYDAHDPYDPPEPFKSRYASAPYDGEIAYVDSAVGKFLDQLRAHGLYENSLIAVMSDHGEGLGAHGENTHGIFLYDETIHVPFLLKLPNEHSAGKRIAGRVRLVDVLPTILDVSEVPIPQGIQGESLLPLIIAAGSKTEVAVKDKVASDRAAYSESDYPHRAFGWSTLRSLRTGKYLFIDAPRSELYDETMDPKAEHNLSSSSKAVTETLGSQMTTLRQKTTNAREAPKVSQDPELQEKLAALGYVASSSTLPGVTESRADPKDKIEIVNLLHQAELLEEDTRFADAVPLLKQAIAKENDIPIAYLKLGTALSILKKYDEAVPVLRKAVELRPDLTVPRYQLGAALFETGDFAGSAKELETVVERSPEWGEARFSLATAYARMDRLPDAIREYQKVIELRPKHYGAHLLLGRALTITGKPQDALAPLQEAAQLQPNSPEPHQFLADAYSQLGRNADAEKERGEAQRLGGRATN